MATTNPLDKYVKGRQTLADIRLNEIPKLAGLVSQYGFKQGMDVYDQRMEGWRQATERLLKQLEGVIAEVERLEDAEAETPTTPTTPSAPAAPAVDISGITAAIAALTDELAAHIAATIVHGTSSPVVGVTDEQALERKTIGMSEPRDARFRHMLQVNEIEVGESFDVPAGFNMVVAGPFAVNGTLTVFGNFAVV